MMDKLAEKEKKRLIEKMKRDEEIEKFLNEINKSPCLNLPHQHTSLVGGSPFGRVSLQSTEHSSPSSSCFSSNGFCFSEDDASPFSKTGVPYNTENTNKYKTQSATDYANALWVDSKSIDSCYFRENVNESVEYELGLCENLCRMNIGEEHRDHSAKMKRLEMDPLALGYGFADGSLGGGVPYNVEKYGTFDAFNYGAPDYQGLTSSHSPGSVSLDDETKSFFIGFGGGYDEGDFKESNFAFNRSDDLRISQSYTNMRHHPVEQRMEQGRSWNNIGSHLQNPSRIRPCINDALVGSQLPGLDSNRDIGVMNHLFSNHLMHRESDLDFENLLYNRSMLKERTGTMPNNRVSEPLMPVNGAGAVEGFGCEDSFIIQGKSVNHVVNKGRDSLRAPKKNHFNEITARNPLVKISKLDCCGYDGGISGNGQSQIISHYPLHLLPNSSSLAEVRGYIYSMAKDQNGCRFLQRVFDEGTYLDLKIIFDEVIDHIVELMMEQFGNYLVQKLLNVCTEEQRIQILLMVTKEPGQLVRVCLNTYG